MTDGSHIWTRAKAIVGEACDTPPDQRRALVDARCAGDEPLRREVESLLAAADSSTHLLDEHADSWVGVAARPASPLPARGRFGKFSLERVLAAGSLSVVYLARQHDPDRTVALKVLRSFPVLGVSPRFWLEASAAARVEHPCVVRVYEAGLEEIAPGEQAAFLSMEFVDGVPITQAVRDRRLPLWDIVSLLEQVAAGVARAHQCGVIHRDLKPTNVLVDRDGRPRVVDFGVARLTTAAEPTRHTLDGAILGTPGYISPEQIDDPAAADVRSDVWSLGAIAYELLSGAAPFAADAPSALTLLARAAREDPPPLSRSVPAIPKDLEAVVMKALARQPAARYASMSAFAEDLENARLARPVRARRSTWTYTASRFVRRNAAAVAAAAVVAVVLAVLAGMQAVAWREASRQRTRASAALAVMRDLISTADPSVGRADTLARDALASMERNLERRAALDPLTEAEVRSLLGKMAFGLGESERARTLLETALALRRQADDDGSPSAVDDQTALAQALRWLYRPADALAVAEAALDAAVRRWGPRHPSALAARQALIGCWVDLNRLSDAEPAYADLLADADAVHGRTSAATLSIRGDRAHVLFALGRYAEAEAEQRELVELWKLHPGAREQLTSTSNLASVLAERGRLDDAVAILLKAETEARAAVGPTHPTTVSIRSNLAEFIRRQGREADALERSRLLVDDLGASLGWAHDQTLEAVTGLIAALVRAEQGPDAVALARKVQQQADPALAPDSPWRARLDSSLAAALGAAGDHHASAALHASAVRRLEASLGPDHRQTLVARNNFAVASIDAGMHAAAVTALRAVLEAVERLGYEEMRPPVWRNLGRALLGLGDVDAGRAALQGAYDLSLLRQETQNARVCARLLAEHFHASGDRDAAALWAERLAALR